MKMADCHKASAAPPRRIAEKCVASDVSKAVVENSLGRPPFASLERSDKPILAGNLFTIGSRVVSSSALRKKMRRRSCSSRDRAKRKDSGEKQDGIGPASLHVEQWIWGDNLTETLALAPIFFRLAS